MLHVLLISLAIFSLGTAESPRIALLQELQLNAETIFKTVLNGSNELLLQLAEDAIKCEIGGQRQIDIFKHWINWRNAFNRNLTEAEAIYLQQRLENCFPFTFPYRQPLYQNNFCIKQKYDFIVEQRMNLRYGTYTKFQKSTLFRQILNELKHATSEIDKRVYQALNEYSIADHLSFLNKLRSINDRMIVAELMPLIRKTYEPVQTIEWNHLNKSIHLFKMCKEYTRFADADKWLAEIAYDNIDFLKNMASISNRIDDDGFLDANLCSNGDYATMRETATQLKNNYLYMFEEKARPILQRLSDNMRKEYADIFELFDRFAYAAYNSRVYDFFEFARKVIITDTKLIAL